MVNVCDPQGELNKAVLLWLLTVITKIAVAVPFVTVTVLELGDTCIAPELPGVPATVTLLPE
jgi:hypothetical protein